MASKFIYANGFRAPKGIPAEVAHRELRHLKQPGNGIDPEDVVDGAKDPNDALHGVFEWADDVAAHQYRLDQARYLIRSIRIVFEEAEPVEFRAFINLEDDAGYHTAADVESDDDLRLRAIHLARRDVDSARATLRQFEELVEVGHLLKQVQDALGERCGR